MDVEGLWFLQLASVQSPGDFLHGGIVVLESGRVFGADSVYSYLGDYKVEGDELIAQIRTRTWNTTVPSENIFGLKGPLDYQVEVRGQREGDDIVGSLCPLDAAETKLPIKMHLIAGLP